MCQKNWHPIAYADILNKKCITFIKFYQLNSETLLHICANFDKVATII